MRSLRAASAAAVVIGAAAMASCTSGAPPGFSGGLGGNAWTFPLVGALEEGALITPVILNTHGPYLFLLDPDAPLSIVDAELLKVADLRPIAGPPRLDETDTQRARAYTELIGLEVGTLIVERRDAMVVPRHSLDASGRRIHGVLGRDVLADSLVFGFDRDRGLGHLVAAEVFRPPAGSAMLTYALLQSRVLNAQTVPLPRRLVTAQIGGAAFPLHVDLGAAASQLREGHWERAQLVSREIRATVIDEAGTPRAVSRGSEPAQVLAAGVGGLAAFIPYADQRWEEQDVAGTLGLGFFADYKVWASWHTRTIYVAPRRPAEVKTRIQRWESPVLTRCPNLGCIAFRVIDPLAGKPPVPGKPHPGLVLSITRDEPAGGMGLEVVLEAEGEPRLPYQIVNLPAHVDRLIHQLKPELLGRTLQIVDASPYPRPCPGGGGCVDQIAR